LLQVVVPSVTGMNRRRFPPPWSVEDLDACFVVRDDHGQALAYVYYEEEPGSSIKEAKPSL
jgi:hypothetical protein